MQVAIYLYDGMTALDAIGPYDLLNRLPGVTIEMIGDGPGPKEAQGGLALTARKDLSEVSAAEVVLVPGGGRGIRDQLGNDRLLEWLRAAHQSSVWTTSVCTGALILGAAGLLDGARATTHWRARDVLARYGATYVDERVVEDGRVITGAGVTAGLDMALVLIERLAGRQLAEAVQLSAHYDPQPPLPAQHHSAASRELLELIDQLGPS